MEATMESTTSLAKDHAPVGLGRAFLHELKLLWTSRRPLLLILAGVGLLAVAGQPWSSGTLGRLFFVWPLFVVVIGPVWAFAVLSNENPSNRLYHWSQPVARHVHSLARLLAGLAWLWTAYVLVAVVALAFATADGNAWQLQALGGLAWLNLFTGALIGYLAVSIFTLASDYPVRWFLGVLFLFPVTLNLLSEWEGPRRVATALARVITDPDWGLGPALVGAMGPAALTVTQLAVDGAASNGATSALTTGPGSWLLATLLWTGILGTLVIVAAAVHPDRWPRLWIRRR
jgi:hypothetical protein